jgi:hypothetical protein
LAAVVAPGGADPGAAGWQQLPPGGPSPRRGAAVALLEPSNTVVVFGGIDAFNN